MQQRNAGIDLLLVAYDGLQYYRMFRCALAASGHGKLDGAVLQQSDARLKSRIWDREANAQARLQFH